MRESGWTGRVCGQRGRKSKRTSASDGGMNPMKESEIEGESERVRDNI